MRFYLVFLLLVAPAYAQDMVPGTSIPNNKPVFFKIDSVKYEINGWTDPKALERYLDWDYERLFNTQADLDAYIEDKKRLLANNRIFQETSLTYSWIVEEDGGGFVVIAVQARDTWNILALPIPKYTDNEGLNLSLRIRDNNFLGTMEQLRINLEFRRSTGGDNSLGGTMDVRFPLDVGGDNWFLGLEASGFYKTGNLIDLSAGWNFSYPFMINAQSYQYGLGQKVSVTDSKKTELTFYTYLSNTITFSDHRLTITPSQSMKVLTDYSDPDGYYTTSRLDVNLSVPLRNLPREWNVSFSTGLFAFQQYLFEKPISFSRSGLYVGAVQNLGAGRWDWIDNLRQGQTFNINYTYEYNFGQERHDNRVGTSLSVYQVVWDFLMLTARLSGTFNQQASDAAKMEAVRGVLDTSIQGHFGTFFNADLTLKILKVNNFQEWWGWSWMRFFNFELHLNLFTDLGYIFPVSSFEWNEERWVWTAGAELIGFPLAARSYFMRLSYGVNLRKLQENDYNILSGNVRELFIGLGHHY